MITVVSLFDANLYISQSLVKRDGRVMKLCERARVKYKKFETCLHPFLRRVKISPSVCLRETERIGLFLLNVIQENFTKHCVIILTLIQMVQL